MKYSILMPVYHKDNPSYFQEAIESMLSQTIKTDDFVIVCDGTLTTELDLIIDKYKESDIFNIVRLKENIGLGNALNYALPICKYDLVARMDSDDISLPDRIEQQLKVFKTQDIDLVSGTIIEYDLEYTKQTGKRQLPETNKELVRFSKKRSPINHPCVMFKKKAVLEVEGYQDFYLMEDYYLWIRMILNGSKLYNIQKPILHMRAGIEQTKRRGGFKYFKSNYNMQKYMLKVRHIGLFRFLSNIITRFIVQVLFPTKIRNFFYNKVLRK